MTQHTLKYGLAKVALATVATVVPQAQTAEGLEEVTVVRCPTNTVTTPTQQQMLPAHDLGDVLRHVPSVTVGGSLGIAQQIFVRGVEDTLLDITVDGAPQTGTLFHHIGRVSIEPELLKQVFV